MFCPTALVDLASNQSPSSSSASPSEDRGGEHEDEHDESDSTSATGGVTPPEDSSGASAVGDGTVSQLGSGYMRLRIRKRVTVDGGRSQLQH